MSFNNFKSDLKFVECAGCNVASLASPTVYNSTIKNKDTGIIIEDPNEIMSVLKDGKRTGRNQTNRRQRINLVQA